MMTVHEVSKLTGVSIRALQYYDEIGLLPPAQYTEAGYRLYDDAALERLQQILLFRELEFPLKEIRRILDSPGFDRNKALEQQIELLTLKREHIDNLVRMAQTVKLVGRISMDFEVFDKKKLEEYAAQARKSWGATPEYKEFEQKNSGKTLDEIKQTGDGLMALLAEFGSMKDSDPAAPEAQVQAQRVQNYITEHYYTCTNKIFAQLGKMYGGGGEFTENIDKAGGPGTAVFASEVIRYYCADREDAKDAFKQCADPDSCSARTRIPLRQYFETSPVSRAQAKSLCSRLDRFREVELDFSGLDWIGQGFAHQIFVVFQNEHPGIKLTPLNMNEDVTKMYRHVMG